MHGFLGLLGGGPQLWAPGFQRSWKHIYSTAANHFEETTAPPKNERIPLKIGRAPKGNSFFKFSNYWFSADTLVFGDVHLSELSVDWSIIYFHPVFPYILLGFSKDSLVTGKLKWFLWTSKHFDFTVIFTFIIIFFFIISIMIIMSVVLS